MNLNFNIINQNEHYYIESANVTANSAFWYQWGYANKLIKQAKELNTDPPNNLITNYLTLRKENNNYYAIRMRPKKTGLKFPIMSNKYLIRDTSKLLPYQIKAVQSICNSIITNKIALDSSDTGLGKTYVALAVCREMSLHPAVVCKKAGIAGWKKACRYMNISPLFITNWEQAKNGKFRYVNRLTDRYSGEYIYNWNLPKNTLLIFDEIHLANNYGSQNCALFLASKNHPSLSLSATIADIPEKCRPIFHVLDICTIEEYDNFLQKLGHFENSYNKMESLSPVNDMKIINKYLFPFYGARLTYKDNDIKDYFPGVVYQSEIMDIGKRKESQYNKLYREVIKKIEYYKSEGQTAQAMVADLRYRQATELLKADSLIEITRNYLLEKKSVCIFVNFLDTLHYLAKRFRTNSLVFGEQEKYKISREMVIDAFQKNKTNLIILMGDAGGTSIDLHDTHGDHQRISLICPPYRAITLKQILGRTYRANSKSVPVIKLAFAANTIEEKVSDKVNAKLDNIAALHDGDLMESDIFNLRKEYEQ